MIRLSADACSVAGAELRSESAAAPPHQQEPTLRRLPRILANVHPGDPAMQRAQRASPILFDEAAKGIAHFRPEQGVIDLALAASPSR